MMIVARIIALLIGYGFGLFQTGYLYGKSKGIDIRQQGSGNAGTTNSLRVLGWKAGIITFAGDLLKAVFAVLLVKLIFHGTYGADTKVLELYAGFGTVLGHNFRAICSSAAERELPVRQASSLPSVLRQ